MSKHNQPRASEDKEVYPKGKARQVVVLGVWRDGWTMDHRQQTTDNGR